MHLANGTLANNICTVTAAVSTASVIYAAYRARSSATASQVLKAVAGSGLVFLAQMWDVPMFGAVSAHLIGAAFLTLLAGPALALLGMTAVIVVQALALHDGGIAVTGANVLNMAVVGVGVSALAIRIVQRRTGPAVGLYVAALVAAVASVMAATLAMTAELALSGAPFVSALGLTMPAHAGFAAFETTATLALVLLAARVRAIKPLPATTTLH
jgi:cobalt/nickel transport system permease protein